MVVSKSALFGMHRLTHYIIYYLPSTKLDGSMKGGETEGFYVIENYTQFR